MCGISLSILDSRNIRFYRLSNQLAPYLTHPDLPAFHRQLDECETELAATGDMARQMGLRLSMHPAFHIQLNSPNPDWVKRSCQELTAAADLLDRMGVGPEAVLVVHVGGAQGDPVRGPGALRGRGGAASGPCAGAPGPGER